MRQSRQPAHWAPHLHGIRRAVRGLDAAGVQRQHAAVDGAHDAVLQHGARHVARHRQRAQVGAAQHGQVSRQRAEPLAVGRQVQRVDRHRLLRVCAAAAADEADVEQQRVALVRRPEVQAGAGGRGQRQQPRAAPASAGQAASSRALQQRCSSARRARRWHDGLGSAAGDGDADGAAAAAVAAVAAASSSSSLPQSECAPLLLQLLCI
ncbi:hypothetical protein COO60DRAFT_1564437, partial [Scenedesmus sp. NREL 46B-D3]